MRRKDSRAASDENELLRAVFDNPEDDDARMVYADALLDRGDPRGEIINLQLARRRRGTPATNRELELLQRHAKQHMGPLWRVMLPNAAEFERGFLSSGFIYRSGSEVFDAEVCGSPWWSTMHHLEGADPALLGHPALRRLTSAVISGVETVCAVADRGPAALRALECHFRLEYYTRVGWDDALEALADPPGLPALTELALVFPDEPSIFHPSPTDYAALLDGALMSRLSRLRLCAHDHDWRYPDPPLTLRGWLTTLAQLRVPRLELDQQRNRYTFERAADRYRLCELHCAWADKLRTAGVASVAGALASLEPGDVAAELRLRLDGKHAWTTAEKAPIHRALERFTHVRPTFVPDET